LKSVRIDFVSDIACPWCAIGLTALEQAVDQVSDRVSVEIHTQPFELNPQMPPGGRDVFEYLSEKYGNPISQVKINQERIYQRAAEIGFTFHPEGRKRVYNTFHGHRLLHWAGEEFDAAAQLRLKKALFHTYFTLAVSMDEPQNLLDAVARANLPVSRAQAVIESDEFSQAVRDIEQQYGQLGISSVPAVIFNQRHLISGAQAPEVYVQAILEYAD